MKTPLFLSAFALLFMVSCSKDKGDIISTNNANTVSMKAQAFNPSTLEVPVGTTVRWVNNDNVPYNVISDDEVFHSGTIQPGQSFTFTFSEAGEYRYHCSLYIDMQAKVIVSSPQ